VRVVVTGGGGFLGRRIVERCLERGDEVTSVSRGAYPELEALGVRCVRADLADPSPTHGALEGAELVFHVAAKAGVWGPRRAYVRANVTATENVLAACLAHGVPRLVYTSSPSVCFDGQDHLNAGPDLPYPASYLAHYPSTKAAAERRVLAANGADLATVALRPHLIIGPRDPHLVPRIVARARSGRLRIVGSGDNLVSLTHVDNAAEAHLVAAAALEPGAACAGRAYFVGNEEPVRLWDWLNEVLEGLGVEPVRRRVSARTAYGLGALCEGLWTVLRLGGEPPMTRFVAAQLSTSHTYDLGEFQRATGYRELVRTAEATRRLIAAGA
jgi:nucleoside-diphosphate-sugar epimerase